MDRSVTFRCLLSGSLLCVGGVFAADRLVPVAQNAAPPPEAAANAEAQEVQTLLDRLSQVGKAIAADPQGTRVWQHQITQADLSLHLAMRSKDKERDDWLRMAIDSLFAAAVQSPANDQSAQARLAQLPTQIAKSFPGCPLWSYAALQEVRADHLRVQAKETEDPNRAQLYLRDRLIRFAQAYPTAQETPAAIDEAARLSESLGKKDDASRCFRYLLERYPGTPTAKKAEGSLWRLKTGSETVDLRLPRTYPSGDPKEKPFDMKDMRGKLVVVYFWTSNSPRAEVDLQTLKFVSDRYTALGLEVVYVSLDKDAEQARSFLSGRLTGGTQVYGGGGLEGAIARQYGIQVLPEVFLVDRDGTVIKHSLQAGQVEAEVTAKLGRAPVK